MSDYTVVVQPIEQRVVVSETDTVVKVSNPTNFIVVFDGAIPEESVQGYNIADLAITTAKLADSAVVTAKMANSAVSTDKLADLAVEAAKLADGAVEEAKIANAAVGAAAIANAAIGSAHIGDAVIQSTHIGDAQILNAHIASIVASKIVASSLDAISANLGEVVAGILTGLLIRTAISGRRLQMDSDGIKFLSDLTTISKYGIVGQAYGSGAKYGNGYVARFCNTSNGIPFEVVSEQDVTDIHLYNRSADPTGPATIGDICMVNGVLRKCTAPGTPGTWADV